MNDFSALDTRVPGDKKELSQFKDEIHIQTVIYFE